MTSGIASPPVWDDRTYQVAWVGALLLHVAVVGLAWLGGGDKDLPNADTLQPVDIVEIAPPAPPPEPEPAVEPAKPVPPEPVRALPDRVVDLTKTDPADAAPPPTQVDQQAESRPVFGLGKQSFGSEGSFQIRAGNTLGMRPEDSEIVDDVTGLKPVPVYQVSKLPKIKSRPDPVYPAGLRTAGIEGDVVLEVLVSSDGKVLDAVVVESSNQDFNQAALDAIYKVGFEPARQGKTAVAVRIRMPVKFRLK